MNEVIDGQENPFVRVRFEIAKTKFKVATAEAIAIGGLATACLIPGDRVSALFGVGLGFISGLYGGHAIDARDTIKQLEPQLDSGHPAEV